MAIGGREQGRWGGKTVIGHIIRIRRLIPLTTWKEGRRSMEDIIIFSLFDFLIICLLIFILNVVKIFLISFSSTAGKILIY